MTDFTLLLYLVKYFTIFSFLFFFQENNSFTTKYVFFLTKGFIMNLYVFFDQSISSNSSTLMQLKTRCE